MYLMLLHDTKWLVQCSNINPAKDSLFPNHNHASPDSDLTITSPKPHIQSVGDQFEELISLLHFLPDELLGMTFNSSMMGMTFMQKSSRRSWTTMPMTIRLLNSCWHWATGSWKKLLPTMSYLTEFLDSSNPRLMGRMIIWFFHQISDHQGPLKNKNPNYNGCSWNLSVHWDEGTMT